MFAHHKVINRLRIFHHFLISHIDILLSIDFHIISRRQNLFSGTFEEFLELIHVQIWHIQVSISLRVFRVTCIVPAESEVVCSLSQFDQFFSIESPFTQDGQFDGR